MTIKWCTAHNSQGNPNFNFHSCWKATAGDLDYKPCEVVRMFLLAVPNDLTEAPEHWFNWK